jgi:uncharacterized protein (TIGR00106 family)
MKVIADVCIVPVSSGLSLSGAVARCHEIFAEAGLTTRLHAYGTNLEGDWDTVLGAIKRCHEVLHADGHVRLSTNLRLGTRSDRDASIDAKVTSVEAKLIAADRPGLRALRTS